MTFAPFLTGSGSPDYDAGRRALFAGLGRGHDGGDLARAVLEGVSFSVRHNLEVLARHHQEPAEWVLGGGGMRSPLWRRITADATRRPLRLLLEQDAGALGTAIAAGYAIGAVGDLAGTLDAVVRIGLDIRPSSQAGSDYDEAYERYRQLVDP